MSEIIIHGGGPGILYVDLDGEPYKIVPTDNGDASRWCAYLVDRDRLGRELAAAQERAITPGIAAVVKAATKTCADWTLAVELRLRGTLAALTPEERERVEKAARGANG